MQRTCWNLLCLFPYRNFSSTKTSQNYIQVKLCLLSLTGNYKQSAPLSASTNGRGIQIKNKVICSVFWLRCQTFKNGKMQSQCLWFFIFLLKWLGQIHLLLSWWSRKEIVHQFAKPNMFALAENMQISLISLTFASVCNHQNATVIIPAFVLKAKSLSTFNRHTT